MPIGSNKHNELQGALLLGRLEFQFKDGATTSSRLGKRRHSALWNLNIEAIATTVAQPRDFPGMKSGKQPFACRKLHT